MHRLYAALLACVCASTVPTACTMQRYRVERVRGPEIQHKELDDLVADSKKSGAEGQPALAARVTAIDYRFGREVDDYRLGKNDMLNIFVMGHPELSSQRVNMGEISGTVVKKDGRVHLPIVGSLPAEGLTVLEFQAQFRKEVAKYIEDPQIVVDVLEHRSQKFYVLGQVGKPGAYFVDGNTRLLDAVSQAGGVLAGSIDYHGSYFLRDGKLMPVGLGAVLERGDVSKNVYMRDGDVLYFASAEARRVIVLGEVQRPGVYAMRDGRLSLAEAIAMAGGTSPGDAHQEVAVLRGSVGAPTIYSFALDEALVYDQQIVLHSGDRIIIAPTGMAANARYMRQVLPFLQGLQSIGIAAQGGIGIVNQVLPLGE